MLMDRAYGRGACHQLMAIFLSRQDLAVSPWKVATETRNSSSMQTAKYLLVTFSYNSASDMYE